jgi:hypothetical protein
MIYIYTSYIYIINIYIYIYASYIYIIYIYMMHIYISYMYMRCIYIYTFHIYIPLHFIYIYRYYQFIVQLLVGEHLLPVKIPCHAPMTGPSRFRQKYIMCGKDLRSLPVINHALLEKLYAIYGDRGTV